MVLYKKDLCKSCNHDENGMCKLFALDVEQITTTGIMKVCNYYSPTGTVIKNKERIVKKIKSKNHIMKKFVKKLSEENRRLRKELGRIQIRDKKIKDFMDINLH